MVSGRYRIDALIGEGGFGEVYRATEVKLDRAVAVKMLRPEILGREDIQGRFQREAQLAKDLNHPNTVRLFDFGQTEAGEPYIVYELLRGKALDEMLHAVGPLPPTRVARITKQVLKSLMEAHEHEVVHRDIKPSNIFLCDFSGEKDFVKVLDFGIAKADPKDQAKLTKMGMAIGTPSYMAPEQVHGIGVGPHTDLYALGLVMAEALHGQIIVDAPSAAETALMQANDKPIPLPAAVLQSSLGAVVQRAVNKDIDRRYQTAAEMLEAIEELNVVDGVSPHVLATPKRGGLEMHPTQAAATGYTPGIAPAVIPPTQPGGPPGYQPSPSHPPQAGAYAGDAYQRTSGYGHAQAHTPHQQHAQQHTQHGGMPAVPRKSSGSSCGIIAGIMGLAGFAMVVLIAIVIALVGGSDKKGGADDDDRSTDTSSIDDGVGNLTARELKRRIKHQGWTISNTSETTGTGFNLAIYTIRKGTTGGSVQLYQYENESVVDSVVDSLQKQNMVFRREDGVILVVAVNKVGGDVKVVSRKVMSQLLQ
jgi:serine/threonine-protein kinase